MHSLTKKGRLTLVAAVNVSVLFAITIWSSWRIDPRDFFQNQIFLYDTFHFYEMAKNWKNLLFESTPNVPAPFVSRIGFPLLSGMISAGTGISITLSAYIVELVAIYFASIFIVREFFSRGISTLSTCIFLIYFLFSWNYPLRMAASWPASGNGTALLAVCLAYLVIRTIQNQKKLMPLQLLLISVIGIFLREIFLLSVLFVFVLGIARYGYQLWSYKGGEAPSKSTTFPFLKTLFGYSIFPSSLVYVYIQSLNSDRPGIIDYLQGYTSLFWTHLNLGNFLFANFSAFGFPLLLICIAAINRSTRKEYFKRISNSTDLRMLTEFCLGGVLISVVFGGDSERYLTWYFPFVAILSAIALDYLLKMQTIGKAKAALIVAIFFLSGRMLVPNLPHMFLVNDSTYCSTAGVKTNYSPSAFFGPNFMTDFKLPVQSVPEEDLPRFTKYMTRGSETWQGIRPMVAASKNECKNGKRGTFFNNYRFEVNNIPVPFGFQHNQYEVYSAWSWWSDWRAQFIYIIQWLVSILLLSLSRPRRQ